MNPVEYAPTPRAIPLKERINFRLIAFIAFVAFVVGVPTYWYVDAELSGGIKHLGNGYTQIDLKAMSLYSLDQQNGRDEDIPQKWRELDGKKVVLTGEMWAPNAASPEVRSFQLCYSIAKCCFSGPPQVQHFVNSAMIPGKVVPVYSGLVQVAGTLHVKIEPGAEGKINSVYRMDVEKVEPL